MIVLGPSIKGYKQGRNRSSGLLEKPKMGFGRYDKTLSVTDTQVPAVCRCHTIIPQPSTRAPEKLIKPFGLGQQRVRGLYRLELHSPIAMEEFFLLFLFIHFFCHNWDRYVDGFWKNVTYR